MFVGVVSNAAFLKATAAGAGTGDGASTSDEEVVEEADYEVIDEEEAKRS